ncbi:hypothetical protein D3C73_1580620 [compost metagenome]
MGHGVEQPEGGHSGQRQRKHDADENAEIVAAVNLGGVLQPVRDLLKEVLQHNEIEGADGAGNHKSP